MIRAQRFECSKVRGKQKHIHTLTFTHSPTHTDAKPSCDVNNATTNTTTNNYYYRYTPSQRNRENANYRKQKQHDKINPRK